jgi:mandelate racemase
MTAKAPMIDQIKVRTVSVSLEHPHRTASGVVAASPLILTDITTSEGVTGHSLIFTYTPAALKPAATLTENIGDLIKGQEAAPLHIEHQLNGKFKLLGNQGLVGMALAAIDMALWDACARAAGLSLVSLLGGLARPIPAYGAVGYDGVKGSAKAAESLAKQGFKAIKAKIGYDSGRQDLEVIRAMRIAAGEDMAIMVDYNQSLLPVEAVERLKMIDQEGLIWIEEPTLAHDYEGHAYIRKQIETPIQCGENWWGVQDFMHAVEAGASDYVMPDVMKIGGVSGWTKVATIAQAKGLKTSNHLWPEISAQLMCLTPNAHWLEYADWWNPILAEPLTIKDGMAVIEGVVGTGVEWNEKAVAKYLV